MALFSKSAPKAATFRVVTSLADVARGDWDAVANPPEAVYNPFLSHDFLWSLEESGCAVRKTGWLGQHLVLDGADGKPTAILPCYLKSHSMGEYVFDHGWADAFERAGGRYYPKLQASVPFTPATGRRLLARDDEHRRLLATAGTALCEQAGASSLHVTFANDADWALLGEAGYLQRTDQQYHFVNDGYRDFDDFLAALSSRHRKQIKRERRDALANGVTIEPLTGKDITEAAWDAFYAFYMDTGGRKWGRPYLNRRFFALAGERMADRILLVIARRDGRPIAGALNFIGGDTLYGRYWGAIEEQPFLHFEVCYYQAIEWGITHGMKIVEAGAQGEHKVARGYRPTETRSAHWIADPGFRTAVAQYLKTERRQVARDGAALAEYLPFKHGDEE
ncbi:MAG TPA: GNAT family N-acetyltransferase [Bauldia sp.]|nr:GNAT family N-acetyltransferase [Bauldia sp.]